MRPSNATARARSSNRPNSPISGGIAGKSVRNELRTPARLVYRGLPGTRRGGWPSCCAAIRAICRTRNVPVSSSRRPASPRRRIRRLAIADAFHPNRIVVEIANDFPDLWGRLFEHGAVICLSMPGPFPDPCVGAERHATMGFRTRAGHPISDRMTPLAFSRAHWKRLKFPNKPPLR